MQAGNRGAAKLFDMKAATKISRLLRECGAVLKRKHKHRVWELPNGRNFVEPKTPSDKRAADNRLSDLKHALGTVKTTATEGERRVKVRKLGPAPQKSQYKKTETLSLAQSLRMAGLTDDALRERMSAQEAQVRELAERLGTVENHLTTCWACRISAWLQRPIRRK